MKQRLHHLLLRTLFLLALVLPGRVGGQVVQGRLNDDLGQPVATALVTLEGEDGTTIRAVVSSRDGIYSIAAGRNGRFRIRVERLGVAPTMTSYFDLGVGEVRILPIVVPPAPVLLEGLEVAATSRCEVRPRDTTLIARLREEASRVLREAPAVEPASILMGHRAVHYRRELDPTGNVQQGVEWRNEYELSTLLPFTTREETRLYWGGFAAIDEEDRLFEYYAPPLQMIFSEPFLDQSCFTRIVEQEGRVGLVFSPMAEMTVTGIGGTIWLDLETLEARLLEYEYYDPTDEEPNGGRGEIEFLTLPDGALLLSRWWIRMPSRIQLPPENVARGTAATLALSEEGGILLDPFGTPLGGGVEILEAIDDAVIAEPVVDLAETVPGDAPQFGTALLRGVVMRTIPSESYMRANPALLASLREISEREIDLLYAGVPTVLELITLKYPSLARRNLTDCSPQVVLNGIPVPNEDPFFLTSPALLIHPREVSRIELHRYGADLTRYGTLASCGVIDISTKR